MKPDFHFVNLPNLIQLRPENITVSLRFLVIAKLAQFYLIMQKLFIPTFLLVASAILRGPTNLAVVAGTNMTMTCEPTPGTNTVDWYHIPVRSKHIIPINYGYTILKNFSEFSVEGKIPGELLSLNITQLKHAGFYQ